MCGIFGVVGSAPVAPALLTQLGTYNIPRGNLAFGGVTWGSETWQIFRYATPFDASKLDLTGTNVVLGHIRAPTGGQSDNLAEVHPFETTHLLLAHNGLLLNHTQYPHWRINPMIEVDSQVILGGIQQQVSAKQTLPAAIAHTVSQLDGQQGCWLWSKDNTQLYLWRVMSSLYYNYRPGRLVFSSVKCTLADKLLPEGAIFQSDPDAQQFRQVGQFDFYSPYKI